MAETLSSKAVRYIDSLNEARCAGRWSEVPELARKVEKHAPGRKCIALSARADAEASIRYEKKASTDDSSTTRLAQLIPPLLTAVETSPADSEDTFQAVVSLGFIHWVIQEPGLAVARLPKDFSTVLRTLDTKAGNVTGWTRVCVVKGAYLKGVSQEKNFIQDAIDTYSSILPLFSSYTTIADAAISPQLRQWTEWLLNRLCLLLDISHSLRADTDIEESLSVFRLWARLFESTPSQPLGTSPGSIRRRVWKAYYDSLSIILQQNLVYTPSHLSKQEMPAEHGHRSAARLQQRAELKRVEMMYEAQLLKETKFPKASERNIEVERWADAVIDNWRVLCGSNWHDEDLGEGGKPGVARGVLDILYRAATKSFHSTQLLRHLFTVHASLAEFELAFKAFDSYSELVSKSKDRAAKHGEESDALDDEDTIMRTAAEAIRILSRFGSRKEAEKALEIAKLIERWTRQQTALSAPSSPSHSRHATAETINLSMITGVSPRAQAVALRSIGISQANWARYTFDSTQRGSLQSNAIANLRKSLDTNLDNADDIEAHYALGLVLAETRDIPGAIKVLKGALSLRTQESTTILPDGVVAEDEDEQPGTDYARERRLIPLWHLLALLLSARSEPQTALKACEAALEQFDDLTVLFGKDEQYRSSHLNDLSPVTEKEAPVTRGLVDQMESFEKDGILQLKTTQLALLESLEGTTAAVDACAELVALYSRLFPKSNVMKPKAQPPSTAKPPKSAVGSIRASIFRKHRASQHDPMPTAASRDVTPMPATTSGPPPFTSQPTSTAPAIHVTSEDAKTGHGHNILHSNSTKQRPGTQRSSSKLQKRKSAEVARGSQDTAEVTDGSVANGDASRNNSMMSGKHTNRTSLSSLVHRPADGQPDQNLRAISHNLPASAEPEPLSHGYQPPKQDTRLPAPFPGLRFSYAEPRFTQLQEKRHQVTALIRVWLFIAALYERAAMFDDSKDAIVEAERLVERFEMDMAQEASNSRAVSDRGWGGGSSVDGMWGDVYAAYGDLALAQDSPHEALKHYERALVNFVDHPQAIVGLSGILLDIYCETIPQEPPRATGMLTPASAQSSKSPTRPELKGRPTASQSEFTQMDWNQHHYSLQAPSAANKTTPSELNRLAARDRAFGLLSSLTKLSTGWDYSEAWFALARAYEEANQIDRAKEILWWCVDLEDARPVRHWSVVGNGGTIV